MPSRRKNALRSGRFHWIEPGRGSPNLYIAWFDAVAHQTCRRSLKHSNAGLALVQLKEVERRGITGDPGPILNAATIPAVGDLLRRYYDEHAAKLASAEQARIAIHRYLIAEFGAVLVTDLRPKQFRRLAEKLEERGLSRAYTSRVLSVARAALKYAEREEWIERAPSVPEIRFQRDMDAEPECARPLTPAELGRWIEAIQDEHAFTAMVLLLNTASRPAAILELHTEQIDHERGLIDLNPPGRVQTKKFRPILRIPDTLRPWIEHQSDGYFVTYRGGAVASVSKAFTSAARRAGLDGRVSAYSIRHSVARHLETAGVPEREISIQLGHERVSMKRTTRRYAAINPLAPTYLAQATATIEAYVRLINGLTTRDLLTPPTFRRPDRASN